MDMSPGKCAFLGITFVQVFRYNSYFDKMFYVALHYSCSRETLILDLIVITTFMLSSTQPNCSMTFMLSSTQPNCSMTFMLSSTQPKCSMTFMLSSTQPECISF